MSTKSRSSLLLITACLMILALAGAQTAAACEATCPHGSCTGNKSCGCDANGYPQCSDYPPAEQILSDYIAYVSSWNLPGLNRVAKAADSMLQALLAKDYDKYFLALLDHEKAVQELSPREQQIRAQWSPPVFEARPMQR